MRTESQRSRPTRAATTPSRRGRGNQPRDLLADLSDRFARFRGEQGPGARVPEDLRAAVLDALDRGFAPADVYRACRVSWGQVAAWKASRVAAAPSAAEPEVAAVRVFGVVDEPLPEATRDGLELRVGAWSVTIRLAEPGAQERE